MIILRESARKLVLLFCTLVSGHFRPLLIVYRSLFLFCLLCIFFFVLLFIFYTYFFVLFCLWWQFSARTLSSPFLHLSSPNSAAPKLGTWTKLGSTQRFLFLILSMNIYTYCMHIYCISRCVSFILWYDHHRYIICA